MDFSQLARYRKHFMVVAFLLFAMGAIARWHQRRQIRALEGRTGQAPADPLSEWQRECQTYACPVLHARGGDCSRVCEEAGQDGAVRVPAERIAIACRKDCAARSRAGLPCHQECFLREVRRLRDERSSSSR